MMRSQYTHPVVSGVHALVSQQPLGPRQQVGPAAPQHPEGQVQLELVCCSVASQTSEGVEAAVRPAGTRTPVSPVTCNHQGELQGTHAAPDWLLTSAVSARSPVQGGAAGLPV